VTFEVFHSFLNYIDVYIKYYIVRTKTVV